MILLSTSLSVVISTKLIELQLAIADGLGPPSTSQPVTPSFASTSGSLLVRLDFGMGLATSDTEESK
jgi:hypothetical protein